MRIKYFLIRFRYFWLQNLLPTIAQTLAVGYGMEKNPTPDFPMQLSIASLFPTYNFDPETNASSESNEIPPNFSLYSNFIMPLFPPARSQTDNVSENDEINSIDPSISALATPRRHTIQTSNFRGKFHGFEIRTRSYSPTGKTSNCSFL